MSDGCDIRTIGGLTTASISIANFQDALSVNVVIDDYFTCTSGCRQLPESCVSFLKSVRPVKGKFAEDSITVSLGIYLLDPSHTSLAVEDLQKVVSAMALSFEPIYEVHVMAVNRAGQAESCSRFNVLRSLERSLQVIAHSVVSIAIYESSCPVPEPTRVASFVCDYFGSLRKMTLGATRITRSAMDNLELAYSMCSLGQVSMFRTVCRQRRVSLTSKFLKLI